MASSKFTKVAKNFNNSFDVTIPSLELLAYHEYNDQLLELERAFLLPPSIGYFIILHIQNKGNPYSRRCLSFTQ